MGTVYFADDQLPIDSQLIVEAFYTALSFVARHGSILTDAPPSK